MRLIDANALLEHIKDLPTWWADGGGIYGQAMKYPEGMFDVDDVVASIENAPTLTPPPITGDTSDGYHTFNELYHHRAVLFSVVCNERPDIAWKSKRHYDGTMYDGMFIVGISTPEGQATYHYDIEPYWSMFHVKELEYAPEWDGHTPDEAIRRIGTLTPPNEPLPVLVNDETGREYIDYICPRCKDIISQRRRGQRMETVYQCKYHDNCGQRVDWSNPQPYRRPPEGEET